MSKILQRDIIVEVSSIVASLQQSPFFVTGVTNLDGTHGKEPIDVPVETLHDVAQLVLQQCSSNASFMLIGVGPKQCTVFVVSMNDKLSAETWFKQSCGENQSTQKFSDNFFAGWVPAEYPIKQKDVIIANACAFLRKEKLLVDEEDEYHPPFEF